MLLCVDSMSLSAFRGVRSALLVYSEETSRRRGVACFERAIGEQAISCAKGVTWKIEENDKNEIGCLDHIENNMGFELARWLLL